jgi:hypothetical protein
MQHYTGITEDTIIPVRRTGPFDACHVIRPMIRARKWYATIHPNDWAPVRKSIAGPVIFGLRRMSGMHQLYVEISKARGLCARELADIVRLSAAQ